MWAYHFYRWKKDHVSNIVPVLILILQMKCLYILQLISSNKTENYWLLPITDLIINATLFKLCKMKRLKGNFDHSYLGINWRNFLQIWYVELPRHLCSKFGSNQIKDDGTENFVSLLLSIYYTSFLGHMTHCHVSW